MSGSEQLRRGVGAIQISVFGFLGDGAGRSPIDTYVEELARARDECFSRMWTAQLPHEPDLLVTLAVALREVLDIAVGTGVLPIQIEHPMAMAQRALTVNLISGGRLTLGLGLSHRAVTERVWGIAWDRSLRRMNDYLDGLLPLLDGRTADATGETATTRGGLRINEQAPADKTAPQPASTSPERVYPPCASGVYDDDDLSNIRCVVKSSATNSAPTAAEKTSASEPIAS